MNIYEKLLNIQTELKAPKGQYNSFGKYKYRSCEDILEAVKPICAKNKATLILSDELVVLGNNQTFSYDETYYDKDLRDENSRTIVIEGQRYYIKAMATLIDIESGEKIFNTSYAREETSKKGMDGSQITGTASSYARKYALNGLFNIDDTKDADTDEFANQNKAIDDNVKQEFQVNEKVTEVEAKSIYGVMVNKGLSKETIVETLKSKYGVNNTSELTKSQYGEILRNLNKGE